MSDIQERKQYALKHSVFGVLLNGSHEKDTVLARSDGEITLLPGARSRITPAEARILADALIAAADWCEREG